MTWLLASAAIVLLLLGTVTVFRRRHVIAGIVTIFLGVCLLIAEYWSGAEINSGDNITPQLNQPTATLIQL